MLFSFFMFPFFFFNFYLFILAGLSFSCSIRDLSLCHANALSSSLTRDRTWTPCIGDTES